MSSLKIRNPKPQYYYFTDGSLRHTKDFGIFGYIKTTGDKHNLIVEKDLISKSMPNVFMLELEAIRFVLDDIEAEGSTTNRYVIVSDSLPVISMLLDFHYSIKYKTRPRIFNRTSVKIIHINAYNVATKWWDLECHGFDIDFIWVKSHATSQEQLQIQNDNGLNMDIIEAEYVTLGNAVVDLMVSNYSKDDNDYLDATKCLPFCVVPYK